MEKDKRQFSVYPTPKTLSILPEIKQASRDWMDLISLGIPQNQLDIFATVLEQMQERAREIIEKQEANK